MDQQTVKTRKITILAMLSAIAYLVMLVGRIPVVLFLKYDPKDVIIAIGGFFYGPLAAFMMSVTVSFAEMITVSSTGFLGFIMNILSSVAFACTAAFVYKKVHTVKGAAIGLVLGCILMTSVMLLWNYIITPIFLNVPREDVLAMLIPYILPFNLLKSGLNSAIVMLCYKPIKMALQRSHLMELENSSVLAKSKLNTGIVLISCFIIATCILIILIFQGKL